MATEGLNITIPLPPGIWGKEAAKGANVILGQLKEKGMPTGLISDGYHTFDELYAHRIALFIKLCRCCAETSQMKVWRSVFHSDGSTYPGWFILGINKEEGKQITYHLPAAEWVNCDFAETLKTAPNYDGHTSNDVLLRLKNL